MKTSACFLKGKFYSFYSDETLIWASLLGLSNIKQGADLTFLKSFLLYFTAII